MLRTSPLLAFALLVVSSFAHGGPMDTAAFFRVHVATTDLDLNPQSMHDIDSMMVNLQVHRGLFRYTSDGEVRNDLVDTWTVSQDRLTYVFKLRKAKFSNGAPITAEHVRQSFARLFHTKSAMSADLSYVDGVSTFQKSGKLAELGIRAVSDSEVQFKLSRKVSVFLSHLATVDCAVLSSLDFKETLPPMAKMDFAGPYKVVNYRPGRLTLAKWRSDALDSKNPPQVIEIVSATQDEAFSQAVKGKADVMDNQILSRAQIETLKRAGWQSKVTELARERFIVMNPATVPKNVRAYLAAKYSAKELVAKLSDGNYKPAYGLIPDGIPGGLQEKEWREAIDGHSHLNPPPAEVELMYSNESQAIEPVISELKRQWEAPGFRLKLKPVPTQTIVEAMTSGKGQLVFGAKAVDYPDGLAVLNYFKSGQESNLFHVKSGEIDKMIDHLPEVEDERERVSLYRKTQIRILKELMVIPLIFGSNRAGLWSAKFKTVPPHPMGLHTLPFETLELAQ